MAGDTYYRLGYNWFALSMCLQAVNVSTISTVQHHQSELTGVNDTDDPFFGASEEPKFRIESAIENPCFWKWAISTLIYLSEVTKQ